uniref:Response regulator PleD n=1 Tax=mine drainage metagenome TaxID=410659 RepID=E6PJV1_9ZZZZ
MELTDLQARNQQILALLRETGRPMPSPGSVALELMRAVERRDVSVFEVCNIARTAPMLVARTVQMANSALYSGLRPTAAMEDAVMRIGVVALARLAVGLSLVHAAGGWDADFDLNQHWRCALARGLVLQHLARRLRNLPSSEAFTLGLLGNIGQLAMVSAYGARAATADEGTEDGLLHHQRRLWGFDQNQASAALLDGWGFPISLWLAALPIGQDTAHAAGRGGELSLTVDVARCMAVALCGPVDQAELPRLYMGAARLGLDAQAMIAMLDQLRADFPSMARILDISTPNTQAEAEFQRLRAALSTTPPIDRPGPGAALVIATDKARASEIDDALQADADLRVIVAPDLWRGLEWLRDLQPDVLVLSAELAGVDVVALCRELRAARGPRLYILLVTDDPAAEMVLQAMDAGANDVLAMPADARLLLAKVRLGGRTVRLIDALEQERHNAFDMQRELARLNANLRAAAYSDDLTGLPNRRALDDFLQRVWAETARVRQALSVVIVDLDAFKQVNDNHGHEAGDRVLVAVAQALRAQTRASDMLARWGGEEIVLVCPGTDAAAAALLAERMRGAVERLRGDFPQITLSAGVAQASPADEDFADVMRAADAALLQAKRDGRNRVVVARAPRVPVGD